MSQLVPDIAFHLVGPTFTAKQCWDNLRQFYCPNSDEDIDDLTQAFWGLNVEDDVDIDEFVQKMAVIRGRIVLINRNSAPSDSSMKKRILNHFIKCCGGFYMSTVITLKDPKISLEATVSAIRASQAAYRELHPTSMVALVNYKPGNNPTPTKAPPKRKNCAHCGRMGHLREECFIWLDTVTGSRV
ncbi:hypothetical protein K3495_g11579 [Podosphaera aphanis]|nr:hypothetical protein K3495_g11579 [Podosphaera aphanis]